MRVYVLQTLSNHDLVGLLLSRSGANVAPSVLRGHYLIVPAEFLVHLRRTRDPRATSVQSTSSPIERDSHLLVRAHVILASVGDTNQERVIGETLVALA